MEVKDRIIFVIRNYDEHFLIIFSYKNKIHDAEIKQKLRNT